jgi:tRNA threonylcarbamoyladenosine biosynthesis protein TsaE
VSTARAALAIGDTRTSRSPEATMRLAETVLAAFPERRVFALHGDLGTGKTCFVRGLARALGITGTVTSPTFTIVRQYDGRRRLVHADLYRLQSPDELLAIGFEELLETPGITAIEWAERAGELLPADALHLTFELDPATAHRRISLA